MFKNYYVTTCGRIFIKHTNKLSVKDLGTKPTLRGTFLRFIRRNGMSEEDFDITFSGERNSSGKKLFYFKCKKWCPDYYELHGCVDSNGYVIVTINGKSYRWHRVVMMSLNYIEGCENMQINHIDGNKQNNATTNLEWCDAKHNINHAWEHGLARRTEELDRRTSKTLINKTPLEHVFNPEYKGQKPNIKTFLKVRGLNFNDYEYVITSRTKSGHALGYLKTK